MHKFFLGSEMELGKDHLSPVIKLLGLDFF